MTIQKSHVILDEGYQNKLMRDFTKKYENKQELNTPQDVAEVMREVFQLQKMAEEFLYLIATTNRNQPISFFEVSHGSCNEAPVGIREIFIRLLLCGAVNFFLVHNHPSGVASPSADDIRITKRVQNAAELLGITFLDHVILGRDDFYSLRENDEVEKIW